MATWQRRVQKCVRKILAQFDDCFVADHLGFHLYSPEQIEREFTPHTQGSFFNSRFSQQMGLMCAFKNLAIISFKNKRIAITKGIVC